MKKTSIFLVLVTLLGMQLSAQDASTTSTAAWIDSLVVSPTSLQWSADSCDAKTITSSYEELNEKYRK